MDVRRFDLFLRKAEEAKEITAAPEAPKSPEAKKAGRGKHHREGGRGEIVNVGSNSNLAAGDRFWATKGTAP